MLNKKIERDFTYHPPVNDQAYLYTFLRDTAKGMAYDIDAVCPDCSEKSTAMMKLNEVVFWANAAIARYGDREIKEENY